MIKDLFSLREDEIFKTLKELKGCDFVIIGGYAVNAYALPRFSVDCDIVIKDETELRKIEEVLLNRGYEKKRLPKQAQYAFFRYEKRLDDDFFVSMDVLLAEVIDRMTESVFSAEWIFKNSNSRVFFGKTIAEEIKMRIINIDALLVMKIISCRATDIRDVFMMLLKASDKDWIKSEISIRYDFFDRMRKISEKISSKQFRDGLSGVYGFFDEKIFEKHKKAVLGFSLKV